MRAATGPGSLRRQAFERLAALSAQKVVDASAPPDLGRLCSLYSPPAAQSSEDTPLDGERSSAARVPMGLRELEVLLALCRSAPQVKHEDQADRLLRQIAPYLPEAHTQAFRPSPFLREIQPSVWEVLVRDLTSAILTLARFPSLYQFATSYITRTVDGYASVAGDIASGAGVDDEQAIDAGQAARVVRFSLSLLGFLNAFSEHASACSAHHRFIIVQRFQNILSPKYMIAIEGTLSSLRNTRGQQQSMGYWKRILRTYAAGARPLGAMLLQHAYMHYVAASCALFVAPPASANHPAALQYLINGNISASKASEEHPEHVIDSLVDLLSDTMNLLDADADFLQVSSVWQQRLSFSVKANILTSFLCCSLVNEPVADADLLMSWCEGVLANHVQLADDELAQITFKTMTVLAKISKVLASSLARSLSRLVVQARMTTGTAAVAADCLAEVLQELSQDKVISTLYSLGNVLSSGPGSTRPNKSLFVDGHASNGPAFTQQSNASAISLGTSDAEETTIVHGTIVEAIVQTAKRCDDEKITALAMSMLVQKIGRATTAVDVKIITTSASLALKSGPNEFKPLLKLYSRLVHDGLVQHNSILLQAVSGINVEGRSYITNTDQVMDARLTLSQAITRDSALFEVYLMHMLDLIVSMSSEHGGKPEGSHGSQSAMGALEIAQMLRPFALLVSSTPGESNDLENPETVFNLSRDAWFNLIAHGFRWNSALAKEYSEELQMLSWHSTSLVDKDRAESQESGLELNTVLRRSSNTTQGGLQKAAMITALPNCEADISRLEHSELTFLNAAYLIATLRARAGDCTRTMEYFFDPKFKSGALSSCLTAVSTSGVDEYLNRTRSGQLQQFAAPELALQLVTFFQGSCHRIAKVQHVAISAADRIISQVPSALCQRASLFAMLELLTLMWTSCLEADTDEYQWKSNYKSDKGNVSIQLSDDFAFRRSTLNSFHRRCRTWVSKVMDIAPLDMKGLLQTYLSDYDDDGDGHISLGRSFALEMGCLIPNTDQRLTAIERQRDVGINSASDFVAHYTTRQEYRTIDNIASQDQESAELRHQAVITMSPQSLSSQMQEAAALLKDIQRRAEAKEAISAASLRAALRSAAALLCSIDSDAAGLIQYLVLIPFTIFTKHSIKLGISLWSGVMRENSKLQSRILTEIAAQWETSVRKRRGIFNPHYQHLDPFYVKEEFAPSNREAIIKRQQITHDLIAPHFRLVQFLSSHFSATRLCSPFVERAFFRLMRVTLAALGRGASQPLARELHFHIILLALRILVYSTGAYESARWKLKDQILSAGLGWFKLPPRWSFGGNKLQIKAELQLMADVIAALRLAGPIGTKPTRSLQSLHPRQELLLLLLQSETTRLGVWLAPLGSEPTHMLHWGQSSNRAALEASAAPLLSVAWAESPSLAVQLAARLGSVRLSNDVRYLLLRSPERALDEPDALQLMLGNALPKDVSFQLKYLLYWAPVNPITAVTYFLPAYGNHPFIIQYAMRALESHSIDVTFFYVPQIVQTLRYDVLGYVERYIIGTAKFSQLFAHQIIWNMKANAYKDDASEIPDPVKPTLDKVMDALIGSFSATDKDFYEREFNFFNQVTGISGKLRPFLKSPKPVKKQKIEEELRKIPLDVGVYLPSNPDGVIIGIDRKSGKPLQSHAKAPFMATFRIRKELGGMEAVDEEIDRAAEGKDTLTETTYDTWQSAIFKVGDDCRQDVLALQMIAAFRGIFNNVGLDVYVFPYRVTATAPGCGVIDVLPNSISRDMLGREAVNGLYEYFVSKYGSEDSLRFQAARSEFVKSMAAYSVISYLLQFKDRHNGNIMVDDAGHILHIDFGFCFDIAPGGVKFERAPFKLTSEMVAVMGGSTDSQAYRWFEELCVKAFLASRQHAEKLCHMVVVMLDSGLPCFKPVTVQHLRERFVLDKSEREAGDFMRFLIKKSEGSYSTGVYDQFQLLTNGIPY